MAPTSTDVQVPGLEQELNRQEAEALVRDEPEAAVFALMALSAELARKRAAEGNAPSAPSSATPVYKKPTTRSGRRKKTKRGARPGHPGHRRTPPPRIDRTESHPIKV